MGQEGRLQLPWKRLIGSASQAMGGSMGVPSPPQLSLCHHHSEVEDRWKAC